MNNNPKDSREVKLKPIKLIVKKPQAAKEIINTHEENAQEIKKISREQQIIDLFASLRVLLIIVLLICIVALIVNIKKEQKKAPENSNPINTISRDIGLFANWQTPNGYTFTFQNDNKFYIYESGLNIQNNYYEGVYEYKEGNEAIIEMGYSEDNFTNDFNIEAYLNIYSIHMKPKAYIKNGNNIINRKIEPDEEWWYILILTDNNNAIAYNKTLDVRYQLIRK